MNIDVVFEATDTDLQVSFDDKLQLVSSGILNDADKVVDGTVSGVYGSGAVTSLREGAFWGCSLSNISLPNCTSIGNHSFRACDALESVNLPSCVSFATTGDESGAFFRDSKKLKSIDIPNLTTIENGQRAFNYCSSLEELNAPNLTSLTNTSVMFSYCTNIRKINFPKLGGTTINASAFPYCYKLETLILGGKPLNPLDNVNAFRNTGTDTENGLRIYVPDDLVDTYKAATNWVTFADQIRPISELEE